MTLSDNTITTVCWCVAFVFAIQAFSTYAMVRLLSLGKPIFARQSDREDDRPRLVVRDR